MSHARFDAAARGQLKACVADIEKNTHAEFVLIVRARSDSYRSADYLFGSLLAFVALLFLIFSPVTFNEIWVPIDVALLFVLGVFVSSRSESIRRLLTSEKRRAQSVRTHAAAMFYEAGIANTDAEMGVLLYLSLLERRLELIADRGILKAVPALDWNNTLSELHAAGEKPDPQTLSEGLRKLGCLLAAHLPAAADNINELPDEPRFELK
jgi:putative membrane protein